MKQVVIDISRKTLEGKAYAVLALVAPGKPTSMEMLTRFKRAVSQWLANTERGKLAWRRAGGDFNYGDFQEEHLTEDIEFLKFLEANGLESAEVKGMEAEDLGEDYDMVIRPEGK